MRANGIAAFGLALSMLGTPALADVAGRYETVDENAAIDMEMTIEANNAGDVRMQMAGMMGYYLLNDGEFFVVQKDATEATVIRFSDLFTVQREVMARMGWKEPFNGIEPPTVHFASMGEEVVGERKGISYGIVSEEQDAPIYASIVIGSDPQLAPLGRAISDAQDASISGMGSIGSILRMASDEMLELLKAGAPLRMLDVELERRAVNMIRSQPL